MHGSSLTGAPFLLSFLALASGLAIGQDASTESAPESAPDVATDVREREPEVTLRVEPILVSARKWQEEAQDVPQSLTILSGTTLRDAGIRDMREASYLVPNLHMTEFSSRRLSFPTFRGISTGTGEPAVTTYVDGVPQLDISSANIALLDVERLEFLRGPQGTL
ncbi:MAG: Plug domain-containing protein, partial [Phycisphaerales bacterium]|nr:Plug domain-containing protein [Phycisphaerales bacterium]